MARVPYGYVQRGATLAIDADQAAVVRRIFAEFTHPYFRPGLTEIAHDLNVDGIPTQRGGQWHASTVKYILSNAGYVELVGAELYQAAQDRLTTMRMGPTR